MPSDSSAMLAISPRLNLGCDVYDFTSTERSFACMSVVVADDKTGVLFLDSQGGGKRGVEV